jgi:CRISPR-associated protein Csm2
MSLETATPQDINKWADDNALQFKKDGLLTNQIRNFYSAVTRLKQDADNPDVPFEDVERALVFLQPRLAYSAGRQKAVKAHFYPDMKSKIEDVLKSTDKTKTLQKFFAYVESVVAYHKFHGGV